MMVIKKFLQSFFALAAVALAVVFGNGYQASAATSQWEARYYNNKTLSGDAQYIVTESAINHDWGHGTPFHDIHKDSFSVRWYRTANFPTAGTYRFTGTMDDGMRVWVDDRIVIDSWTDSQQHSVSGDIALTAGDHNVKVEYYEAGGVAIAKLDWVFVGGSAPPTNAPQITNWRGEYFNNKTLTGSPNLIRDDAQLNFDWGTNSPSNNVITADGFSVRWTRSINLSGGQYRFTVTADDGVRLWVNGLLVVDQWRDGGATSYNVDINLPSGNIPLKVEYYENTGAAVAKLSWVQLGGSPTPVPTQPSTGWYAEYFNNKHLNGLPLSTRNEANLDFNWGYGSPVPNLINVDQFSARWTRTVDLAAGTYRFTATSDDGMRVYVNNTLVINAWSDHAVQTFTGDVTVSGGPVTIKVEYYDNSLLAEAHVSWSRLTSTGTPTNTGMTASVTAGALNVRRGPGVSYGVLTAAYKNQVLTLTGYRANVGSALWVSVKTANGTTGWVNSAYLATNYPLGSLTLWQ